MWESFKQVIKSKPGMAALIALLLLVPLSLIENKVRERSSYRHAAVVEVSQSWSASQTLLGPMVVVEYQVEVTDESAWSSKDERFITRTRVADRVSFVPMEALSVEAQIETDTRYRGIYPVPVYTSLIDIAGRFEPGVLSEIEALPEFHSMGDIYLWVNVSDQRGFTRIPVLNWGDDELPFVAGGHQSLDGRGIIAKLRPEQIQQDVLFQLQLGLRGTQSLGIIPSGNSTQVKIKSDWPHPKFSGHYLPSNHHVNTGGFDATWEVTNLASNITRDLVQCAGGECMALLYNQLAVELIEPVDLYLMTERAVKYGLLYVVLVLAFVVGVEIYQRLDVHPLQYLMVGVGVSIFYLLLLSLSEHLPFLYAYAISTSMCVALLTYYGTYILGSIFRGVGFGATVAMLFTVLLVILRLEDTSLLFGSLLTFVAVTLLMVVTRDSEVLKSIGSLEARGKEP